MCSKPRPRGTRPPTSMIHSAHSHRVSKACISIRFTNSHISLELLYKLPASVRSINIPYICIWRSSSNRCTWICDDLFVCSSPSLSSLVFKTSVNTVCWLLFSTLWVTICFCFCSVVCDLGSCFVSRLFSVVRDADSHGAVREILSHDFCVRRVQ